MKRVENRCERKRRSRRDDSGEVEREQVDVGACFGSRPRTVGVVALVRHRLGRFLGGVALLAVMMVAATTGVARFILLDTHVMRSVRAATQRGMHENCGGGEQMEEHRD